MLECTVAAVELTRHALSSPYTSCCCPAGVTDKAAELADAASKATSNVTESAAAAAAGLTSAVSGATSSVTDTLTALSSGLGSNVENLKSSLGQGVSGVSSQVGAVVTFQSNALSGCAGTETAAVNMRMHVPILSHQSLRIYIHVLTFVSYNQQHHRSGL